MTEVKYIETRHGKIPLCKCGSDVHWQECGQCDEGYSSHDCGEDTCCCRDPRPNVECDVCNGEGGWWVCYSCTIKSQQKRIRACHFEDKECYEPAHLRTLCEMCNEGKVTPAHQCYKETVNSKELRTKTK